MADKRRHGCKFKPNSINPAYGSGPTSTPTVWPSWNALLMLRHGRVCLLFGSRGLVSARRSNDAVRVGPYENFGNCLPLCFVLGVLAR
jgi:hypothetical protein